MREIKFRAWEKDGHYSRDGKARMLTVDTHPSSLTSIISDICLGSEIRDSHVMQHTGLKDKLGVDIYDGDIIRVNRSTRDVRFAKGSFIASHDEHCSTNLSAWDASDLEVIGNIYENPELLKANDE